ncbi:MAG: dihydrodipicolinate synthase family protein [Chloroflexota bacterium]|nr:dihydrodipicolinate synthase family protein [Chloroflexota bacterium]
MNQLPPPLDLIRPRRQITGISAILLPFTESGDIDWGGFAFHVARTADAGLTPAVNMDTGYVNLIDDATRHEVLRRTASIVGGNFAAGAFVKDDPVDMGIYAPGEFVGSIPRAYFNLRAYMTEIERIQAHGGTPVIFQSYGLTHEPPDGIIRAYEAIAAGCDRFIAFELGTMFAPFGKIYDLAVYEGLLNIRACIGAKHSSLSRALEWDRLRLRDRVRPDFKVFTGNDLAIDMVMYGSDYLLGLSTFAPDAFAQRDALWAAGDPAFYELNDVLQYLGMFAFRPPVPAYKHSAAQFLKLRGWLASDHTHPRSPARSESDTAILSRMLNDIAARMGT